MMRTAKMVQLYEDGLTLQEIGDKFGISRSRVQQIIHHTDPTLASRMVKERARDKIATQFTECTTAAKPCRVCGYWVLRKSPMTCSRECAQAWKVMRWHLNPEYRCRMRMINSGWTVRHPEFFTRAQVKSAQRRLAGKVKPRCESRYILSPRRAELARKFGLRIPVVGGRE